MFTGRDEQLRQLAGLLRTQRPGEVVAMGRECQGCL